jgi:hypothetical protein
MRPVPVPGGALSKSKPLSLPKRDFAFSDQKVVFYEMRLK